MHTGLLTFKGLCTVNSIQFNFIDIEPIHSSGFLEALYIVSPEAARVVRGKGMRKNKKRTQRHRGKINRTKLVLQKTGSAQCNHGKQHD